MIMFMPLDKPAVINVLEAPLVVVIPNFVGTTALTTYPNSETCCVRGVTFLGVAAISVMAVGFNLI